MYESKSIKISNAQRQYKRNNKMEKINHLTPEKYLDRQSTYRTVDRLQKKFGYDYDFEDSKPLKYMKEEFLNSTVNYLGKSEWTKKLGRKQKYERNIELGKPLKQNPLLKIFNRVQKKLYLPNQAQAFQVMKIKFHQQKLKKKQ